MRSVADSRRSRQASNAMMRAPWHVIRASTGAGGRVASVYLPSGKGATLFARLGRAPVSRGKLFGVD